MSRNIYHVIYDRFFEKWTLKIDNPPECLYTAKKRSEAVEIGRALARFHTPSKLYVHKKDGRIEDEYAYESKNEPMINA